MILGPRCDPTKMGIVAPAPRHPESSRPRVREGSQWLGLISLASAARGSTSPRPSPGSRGQPRGGGDRYATCFVFGAADVGTVATELAAWELILEATRAGAGGGRVLLG